MVCSSATLSHARCFFLFGPSGKFLDRNSWALADGADDHFFICFFACCSFVQIITTDCGDLPPPLLPINNIESLLPPSFSWSLLQDQAWTCSALRLMKERAQLTFKRPKELAADKPKGCCLLQLFLWSGSFLDWVSGRIRRSFFFSDKIRNDKLFLLLLQFKVLQWNFYCDEPNDDSKGILELRRFIFPSPSQPPLWPSCVI